MEENFRKLKVWQKAHSLVLLVYKITATIPEEERYGLISQMRRAAVSIAANLAEGSKKQSVRLRLHFHSIAEGSLEELKYYLLLCNDLGYLRDSISIEEFWNLSREVGGMLHGLSESLKR